MCRVPRSRKLGNINAQVICNHGPPTPSPGNSGDFNFCSNKSLLKAPPFRDRLLVKPLLFSPQPVIFSLHSPFCLYKTNLAYSPCTTTAKLGGGWGWGGGRVTNEYCINCKQDICQPFRTRDKCLLETILQGFHPSLLIDAQILDLAQMPIP